MVQPHNLQHYGNTIQKCTHLCYILITRYSSSAVNTSMEPSSIPNSQLLQQIIENAQLGEEMVAQERAEQKENKPEKQSSQEGEIINQQNSEPEENGLSESQLENSQSKGSIKRQKKPKKSYKCLYCKLMGSKSSMIKCSICRQVIHLSCLEDQNVNKKEFVCQKCIFKKGEMVSEIRKINNEQYEKQEEEANQQLQTYFEENARIYTEKLKNYGRVVNRQQRQTKLMDQFQSYYGHLIGQNGKFKYPINDKIVLMYQDLLLVEDKVRSDPTPHPYIPAQYLDSLLEIETWLRNYAEMVIKKPSELPKQYSKEYMYDCFKNNGQDECFVTLTCLFMRFFINDVVEATKKENMRVISENPFYQVITAIRDKIQLTNEFIINNVKELCRQFTLLTSFQTKCQDIELNQNLSIKQKCSFLIQILQDIDQTNSFHSIATKKAEQIQQLVDTKTKLTQKIKESEMKILQNRKKEAMQAKKVINAQQRNGKSKKKNYQASNNVNKIVMTDTQEMEKNRKKLIQTYAKLAFVNGNTIYLGMDRNESEYYFNLFEPNRIYVNSKKCFLMQEKNFFVLEGKAAIIQLNGSLTNKGYNQRNLSHYLNNLLNKWKVIEDTDQNMHRQYIPEIKEFVLTRDKILSYFVEIQENIRQFYAARNMQWTNEQFRQQFISQILQEQSIVNLANKINQAFEGFSTVQHKEFSNNIESHQQESSPQSSVIVKKKVMRIWSVNQEKIKKSWSQYLLNNPSLQSIWISMYMFQALVNRFINRKINQQIENSNKISKKEKVEIHQIQLTRTRLGRKQPSEKSVEKRLKRKKPIINQKQYKAVQPTVKKKLILRRRLIKHDYEESDNSNVPSLHQINMELRHIQKNIEEQSQSEIKVVNHSKRKSRLTRQLEDFLGSEKDEEEPQQKSVQNLLKLHPECSLCKTEIQKSKIQCFQCKKNFHLACINMTRKPKTEWICLLCRQEDLSRTRRARK